MKKSYWVVIFVVALIVLFVSWVSFISDLTGTNIMQPEKHFNWVEAAWSIVSITVAVFSALKIRNKA